ncbi:DUF1631 domain-containing protein [Marinobacter caseinilyticus]|uniref:DUF1631 domain-containing protein n=1 Tax=Marinobacter caseinilyticus TaxID=2692195 RepID=UPI001409ECDA|nr:DUF1631 domain-containing protein [Marinobacter caseinilyticus]
MAQDNKVVNLTSKQGHDRFNMPASLVRLRDVSSQSLKKLLTEFFDGSDDALFKMADRADSNKEQTAYFDAMRELRLRRKHMSLSVLQGVSRAFNELGRFDPQPGSQALEDIDQDSLTLVGHADLEQKVAIDNLMTKLRGLHVDSIALLFARVSHLVPGIRLSDRQMPLSPEVICTALAEASGDLDVDIRAKLVVLKLFDKLLVGSLEVLYDDANKLLISEGVLPDLTHTQATRGASGQRAGNKASRRAVPPRVDSGADSENGYGYDGNPVTGGDATFSELSALLHQDASDGVLRTQGAGGRLLDTRSLMARLGQIQAPGANTGGAGIVSLSAQLRLVLKPDSGEVYSVQQIDNDVINLVTMLFDFILEDRQLPATMKALIGRLQIPVLKVALCDRSFFNRGGHPARKLLNELAMAGIGWNEKPEGQRDPLREKIESVVDRLLTEFTDNVELFAELLKDFSHFMDLDRRRRELVEQRLRDAEEGRARQDGARESVDAMLTGVMADYQVPAPVAAMLREPWRKYLQWVLLREGAESALWSQVTEFTRRLVWSVDPRPTTDQTRGELLRAIPNIVDTLRSSLQSIAWDPFAIDSVVRDLELAHVDVMQQLVSYRKEAPQPSTPSAQGAISAAPQTSSNNGGQDDLTGKARQPEPAVPVQPEGQAPVNDTVSGTLPSSAGSEHSAPGVEPQWLELADKMRVGSWIELMTGDQKVRCKLAAFIKATGKYIFVNRNGAKVAEYQRETVAKALATGELSMLDDGLIFDRALESIIDNLRLSRKD